MELASAKSKMKPILAIFMEFITIVGTWYIYVTLTWAHAVMNEIIF